MNPELGICIATYNRGAVLDDILFRIIECASKHQIPVYVNDNGSNDNTQLILEKYSKKYKYFYPYIQVENVGFDLNFEQCLKRSDAKFIWGMADYALINFDAIDYLLDELKSFNGDALFLNNYSRIKNEDNCDIREISTIFMNVGWHITLLDSIVWSRKMIENADFSRYRGSLFGYYGAMCEYLGRNLFFVRWISKSLVEKMHPNKRSFWMNRAIETWCTNWATMILSLPYSISLDLKYHLIRKHNYESGLFGLRSSIILRAGGFLNLKIVLKEANAINISLSIYNKICIISSLCIPIFMARLIVFLGVKLKNIRTQLNFGRN